MGKRNLTIVGMELDYFAGILDEEMGSDPSTVSGCASPEDAATSYFRSIFEKSNARVREAVIGVWLTSQGQEDARIFDASASMTPCTEPDAENGEFDIVLDVRERPR